MVDSESLPWDSSNPAFNEAWDQKNRETIDMVYEEIGKQWAERIPGATIADVFILCRDLYEKVNDIEYQLDQPGITKQEVSSLSYSLLHTWGDIFKVVEAHSDPTQKTEGGLYLYRKKEDLVFNDWIWVNGVSFEQLRGFLSGGYSLAQIMQEKGEGLLFDNVYIMNDGTVKKRKDKKKLEPKKAKLKTNKIQSSRNLTADGNMQIPVLSESDLFDQKPVLATEEEEEMEFETVDDLVLCDEDESPSSAKQGKTNPKTISEFEEFTL